ncbi:hypothetical protein [Muriicola sp.]|uniref:hypothetical protein n=1 Tax=Muriicola sp. TaxID=2020856 RepID=UPI003C762823
MTTAPPIAWAIPLGRGRVAPNGRRYSGPTRRGDLFLYPIGYLPLFPIGRYSPFPE